MKRIYALSILFTLLLVLAGCSGRLTTEKAQEALNKWMSNYVGSVEVLSMQILPKQNTAYVKLKFSNFVYRELLPRNPVGGGELKDFSGEGTALFVNKDANWVLDTIWVGEEGPIAQNLSDRNTTVPDSDNRVTENKMSSDLKILAQGAYSRVSSSFTVVARDATTYAVLREMVDGLPEVEADFFNANTVVAAFLGGRTTGGFSVEITRKGYDLLQASVKQMTVREIVTQGLRQPSQPYQVISVPLGRDDNINVNFDSGIVSFQGVEGLYEVTSGEFETGGDSAGQSEKFRFNGSIGVQQYGKLVTLSYYLTEIDDREEHKLKGDATGIMQSNGNFAIAPVGAGTFVKQPRSPLRMTGKFDRDVHGLMLTGSLTLKFETLPPKLFNGFIGSGKLEAKQKEPV